MDGFFITFEGVEGCGKSLQACILVERLRADGWDAMLTKEPGGTPVGKHIRDVLLATHPINIDDRCELMLFLADRAQHVGEIIIPALREGKIVVCERYADSTMAYQHYGLGLPFELVEQLNEFVTQSVKPNLTIVLDLEPSEGQQRKYATSNVLDRIERRPLAFHERVRYGYLEIARREPERVIVINASRTPEEIADEVWSIVNQALQHHVKNRR